MTFQAKRRRLDDNRDDGNMCSSEAHLSLTTLLELRQWEAAVQIVRRNPETIVAARDPCPLAVACRLGAPYDCVKVILEAAPQHIRRVLDSRGTPLHEAIVCEHTGANVIEMLIQADEDLGSEISTRATLLQDVDGFTPLHLLIRRRFQTHILNSGEESSLMQILEMLVKSCPEAVIVPDRGEYEEPPIVYAIKANIYSPGLGSEDSTLARVERQIYEMVDCMLRYNPSAASRVFTGYRGQYTALHSAVFHGRPTGTIELILQAEARVPHATNKASLLQNTQGEIPLHFCAMRGERPRSVALIADAAPQGVLKRDMSGLTPFHWLWIRFVSTLLTLEDGGRGTDTTIMIGTTDSDLSPIGSSRYNDFAILERGDFDADMQLFKRIDPALDFLRMRHIPVEALSEDECLSRAIQSAEILKRVRDRHYELRQQARQVEGVDNLIEWTREEAVSALFWTKVVSLLQAANRAALDPITGDSILVHTAFSSKCCHPAVAHLVASLYPEELVTRDGKGQFPLHRAASRPWDRWDWPSEDGHNESPASDLLNGDSIGVLRVALTLTPSEIVKMADFDNRLVLHHAIDTLVVASAQMTKSVHEDCFEEMLRVILDIVQLYPESLQRPDGLSQLYPFQQATATAAKYGSSRYDQFPLSVTYELLNQNPTLLESIRQQQQPAPL